MSVEVSLDNLLGELSNKTDKKVNCVRTLMNFDDDDGGDDDDDDVDDVPMVQYHH